MKLFRKGLEKYSRIIATIEKSAGNGEAGDTWTETKSFSKRTSIKRIIEWAVENFCSGRLIITIDESTIKLLPTEENKDPDDVPF